MKHILIISSSPSFIDRNETLLRRSDFSIHSAESAAEGQLVFDRMPIDLVLLDINLGDMAGADFSVQLTEKNLPVKPIILLVCNDSVDELDRLKKSGAHALLARPIKPLQLVKTVGQFLTVQLVRSRRVSLRVKVISQKDDVEFFCISHNISLTGMMIETEFSLEVGSLIVCQFMIPNSVEVVSEGEIVRSSRTLDGAHQYGIHFINISRQSRHEIDLYIASVVRGEASLPVP